MVGAAVRAGARHRGGGLYQSLAVLLTYLAIVSTYIPSIVQGLQDSDLLEDAALSLSNEDAQEADAALQARNTAMMESAEDSEPSLALGLIAMLVLLAIAMVAPFLMGFENIIGLIIIAIGLYQAWKLNKRNPLIITGPFHLHGSAKETGAHA